MRSSHWVWLACMPCVLGCSQKDPTAAPGGGAGSGSAALADDYYPMVAGSVIVTRHSGNGMPWDDTTMITAAEGDDAAPAFLTEGSPDPKGETSKNVITRDGTRWYRTHKDEFRAGVGVGAVDYEPGFLRFDAAWATAEEGHVDQLTYNRIERTTMGALLDEDTREHTFTVVKVGASVTVPAGTFEDCLQVQRLHVRQNMNKSDDDDDKTYWFCAGVGKVKESSEVGGGTEELVSCMIPGGLCP